MYLQGEGVDKDEAKALEYFKAAALKGVRPSQTNSAIMLEELCQVRLKDPKKMLI